MTQPEDKETREKHYNDLRVEWYLRHLGQQNRDMAYMAVVSVVAAIEFAIIVFLVLARFAP